MKRLLKRTYLALLIALIYANVWILLEKIIDGCAVTRTVDNIIMFLFAPIIFIATDKLVK